MKIACIGTGEIVERALLAPNRALGRPFDIEIVGRNRDRSRHLAETYGCESHGRDLEAVMGDPEIDAAYIALPNHMHAGCALVCMDKGKAVLVEKPLAVGGDEPERLALTAAQSGTLLVEAVMTEHHPWPDHVCDWLRGHPDASVTTRIAFDLGPHRLEKARLTDNVWFDTAPYWAHFLQRCGIELPACGVVRALTRTGSGYLSSIEIEACSGRRRISLSASHTDAFEVSHKLSDRDAGLTIPNFLRPAVGRSALGIDEQWGGSTKRVWIKGGNYYENQLLAFSKRLQLPSRPAIDARMVQRAAFVAALGQILLGCGTAPATFDLAARGCSPGDSPGAQIC
jgi:hypothetical protein